jgi:phage gp16-like protein
MTTLAKIHIAKKQLCFDDDTYRALLGRITGKTTSGNMSEKERLAVLEEMKRQGFKPASKAGGNKRQRISGPYAKRAQALWIALWNLGEVHDRRDQALLAFVCRQTGIERTEWVLDAKDGAAVIEGLKAWCERAGVTWYAGRLVEGYKTRDGYKVARAQYRKLNPGDVVFTGFWIAINSILRRTIGATKPTDAEWILIMNELGKQVRARVPAERKVA